jgi:hypothetical protein
MREGAVKKQQMADYCAFLDHAGFAETAAKAPPEPALLRTECIRLQEVACPLYISQLSARNSSIGSSGAGQKDPLRIEIESIGPFMSMK